MNPEKTLPDGQPLHTITREALVALYAVEPPTTDELAAVRRLIHIAKSDTGQSRRCADFLLAWWNAGSCGGFDFTALWGVDKAIAADMVAVTGLVARCHDYPPGIDARFNDDFAEILREWRPELDQDSK